MHLEPQPEQKQDPARKEPVTEDVVFRRDPSVWQGTDASQPLPTGVCFAAESRVSEVR